MIRGKLSNLKKYKSANIFIFLNYFLLAIEGLKGLLVLN